jgi:hypothetical protein
MAGIRLTQGRRRFVKNEHLRLLLKNSSKGDELLLCGRELDDTHSRVDVKTNESQILSSSALKATPIDP